MTAPPKKLRHLVLLLGDQLDETASALADFDPKLDAVWMAEVREEIERNLIQQERMKAQQRWIDTLRRKAYIKILS